MLVAVDYFTKWVLLFPLRDATVFLIAECMYKLCCRMCFPDAVLTDRGTQFTSELHQEMWAQLGATPKYTMAYHPQTNLTESINKTLVSCLKIFTEQHQHWVSRPELEFAINTAQQESTGFAPCQLLWRDAAVSMEDGRGKGG